MFPSIYEGSRMKMKVIYFKPNISILGWAWQYWAKHYISWLRYLLDSNFASIITSPVLCTQVRNEGGWFIAQVLTSNHLLGLYIFLFLLWLLLYCTVLYCTCWVCTSSCSWSCCGCCWCWWTRWPSAWSPPGPPHSGLTGSWSQIGSRPAGPPPDGHIKD